MLALFQNLRKLTLFVFPNIRLALFCTVLIIAELVGLLSSPSQPFREDWPVRWFVVFWLFWFSLTLSWGIYWTGKLIERSRQHSRVMYILTRVLVGLASGLALLVYFGSWGLYFQVGQFANLEAFRFLLINPPLSIWNDLTVAERIALSLVGLFVAAFLIFSPTIIQLLTKKSDQHSLTPKYSFYWRTVWQVTTILLLLPAWNIATDQSLHRRATKYHVIKTRMHPVATLAFSATDQFLMEPISPHLETTRLTPLTVRWTPPTSSGKRASIIILAVEALRADTVHLIHQGREVLPNINRLAEGGVQFTNAYAQSTHSDYADVCLVSSLYPLRTREHHYYSTADPWPKTLAFDVFKNAGYETAIISSQNEAWGNMDQFLETPNLDLFYDAERSGEATATVVRDPGFAHELKIGSLSAGKLEDRQTMDRAIDWVTQQVKSDQRFFLSMNFQSSHFPYEVPDDAERPFQPSELDADVSFMQYPKERTNKVRNAYYNGIHHCDFQVGRMVETLKELGVLNDVILIVLGENGEAFQENGYCGHAQEPVQPMIHVATVFHAPKFLESTVEDYPVEHVDLVPTLLGLLDWNPHPNFQGVDVFAKDRLDAEDRLLFFHVNNATNQAEAVLLGGRWKLMMDRHLQAVTLFDLKTDPGETTDVSGNHPVLTDALLKKLQFWRASQLSYYHYPAYYSRFYPPPQPVWDGEKMTE